jgi:Ca2+-binding EF-hand superfamily protein
MKSAMSKRQRQQASSSKKAGLSKINAAERDAVMNMFRLYDFHNTGKIAAHHAAKLLRNMGFEERSIPLPSEVTLDDIFLILELELPPSNPSLQCALFTFDRIVGKVDVNDPDKARRINANELSNFMVSIGRPPVEEKELNVLLSKMLDADDISVVPAVKFENFDRDIITFAKKNRIYKGADFEEFQEDEKEFTSPKKKAVSLGDGKKQVAAANTAAAHSAGTGTTAATK